MRRTPVLLLALSTVLTGCSSDDPRPTGSTGTTVAVTASEGSCLLDRTEVPAGTAVLALANEGPQALEVYLRRADGSVVAEREDLQPGDRADLTVEVAAGEHEVSCEPADGDPVPVALTVTGADGATTTAAVRAVTAYRAYVQEQADALVPLVEEFVAAVEAGDVARAKALYAPSRWPWEAVEPVAESFGDLDPRVDLREADLEPGQEWTGWHRLEKALWEVGSAAGTAPFAARLVADVRELQQRVPDAALTVAGIGNGAKELLDEVATGKITGEEEAFSHTDLVDVDANLAGAREAFDVLRPLVADQALLATLTRAFDAVETELAAHRTGPGPLDYASYDTLDATARRALAARVDALAEPLSGLAAAAVAGA